MIDLVIEENSGYFNTKPKAKKPLTETEKLIESFSNDIVQAGVIRYAEQLRGVSESTTTKDTGDSELYDVHNEDEENESFSLSYKKRDEGELPSMEKIAKQLGIKINGDE